MRQSKPKRGKITASWHICGALCYQCEHSKYRHRYLGVSKRSKNELGCNSPRFSAHKWRKMKPLQKSSKRPIFFRVTRAETCLFSSAFVTHPHLAQQLHWVHERGLEVRQKIGSISQIQLLQKIKPIVNNLTQPNHLSNAWCKKKPATNKDNPSP